MPNHNPPIRGQQFEFAVSLASQADPRLFQNNPTLAAGDVKISKLNAGTWGAYANLGTLPSVEPASGNNVKVVVSTTEMDADALAIEFIDAAGAEWCSLKVVIHPFGGVLVGTVNDGAADTDDFDTTLTGKGDDFFNNAFLVFTDGALQGQSRKIQDYTSSSGNIVLATALTGTPANGDPFIIIGRSE